MIKKKEYKTEKNASEHSRLALIHVNTTLRNTIISLSTLDGNVLAWTSSGALGFKGSRKSTSYAAQAAAEKIAKDCLNRGITSTYVKLKGLGYGKESSLRGLQLGGISILKIEDTTPMPFNGCRAPKKRRV